MMAHSSFGQALEERYPQTIWCENDSFVVKFSGYPDLFPYKVSSEKTTDTGTDAEPGLYVTIYYGRDSILIPYHNRTIAQLSTLVDGSAGNPSTNVQILLC
jgi:hypothetical protein